jgi:hypothetical protein
VTVEVEMYANGNEVKSLAELNEQRHALGLEPLTLGDFGGESTESVDWGIATSYELGDSDQYDQNKQAVIDEILRVIAEGRAAEEPQPVQPPAGYELQTDSGSSAYVKAAYVVEDQGIKLLIGAANGYGQDHQSSDVRGWNDSWTAYVHLYGPNTLYAYTYDGQHEDGIPMVTVTAGGNVNAGTHSFDAW